MQVVVLQFVEHDADDLDIKNVYNKLIFKNICILLVHIDHPIRVISNVEIAVVLFPADFELFLSPFIFTLKKLDYNQSQLLKCYPTVLAETSPRLRRMISPVT